MLALAASIYAACCCLVVMFQVALIAGAPWGRLTQGGSHEGRLPVSGRIGAGVSIVVLAAMAAAILSAAGLQPHWPIWTGWVALTVQLISMVLNWITPSRPERRLWGPITTLMFVLALLVVLSR